MANFVHPRAEGQSIDYGFKWKVGTPKVLRDETGITYGTIQSVTFVGGQIWIGFANKTFIRPEMMEDVNEFELHQYF